MLVKIPTIRVTLSFADPKEKQIVIDSGVKLISSNVQNGEQDRNNTCQIVFADEGLGIATRLRAASLKAGGITVPDDIWDKKDEAQPTGSGAGAGTKSTDLPKEGKPPEDPNYYIGRTQETSLSAEYRGYLDAIAYFEGADYNSIVSYVAPITNFSRHPERLVSSANSDAAGRYQYLSTTWKALNLPDFSPKNQDLGAKKLIEQQGAAGAVSRGLAGADEFLDKCSYTWASLPSSGGSWRYPGQGSKTPAQFKAILARAIAYYKGGGANNPAAQAPATSSGKKVFGPAFPEAAPVVPKAAIEISIEEGWSDGTEAIVSSLWYISHSTSTDLPPQTTITGKGVRFLLEAKGKNRKVYKNISIRQVAQRIGNNIGVDVEVPATASSEAIQKELRQTGETDMQFLKRIAAAVGLVVKEDVGRDPDNPAQAKQQEDAAKSGTTAVPKIQLVRPTGKGVKVIKVARSWGAKFKTSDAAAEERIIKTLPPIFAIADDKAIGKGYETTLLIEYPDIDLMSIQPGVILDIPKGAIANLPEDSAFCRQYRVEARRSKFDSGKRSLEFDLYIPVNVKPKKDNSKSDGDGAKPAQTSGFTPAPADPNGQYAVPGLPGKYSNTTPVIQGGQITWGDMTHGGERAGKLTAEYVQNIITLVGRVESIAKPALGNRKISVTSGFRPEPYNSMANGAPNSMHLSGKAMDAYVEELSGDQMYAALNNVWQGGLGRYSNRFHIDIGPNARFDGG